MNNLKNIDINIRRRQYTSASLTDVACSKFRYCLGLNANKVKEAAPWVGMKQISPVSPGHPLKLHRQELCTKTYTEALFLRSPRAG